MRILITTGIYAPEAGGPATYTPKFASKLVEAGHEVTVATYSDKPFYDFDKNYSFRLIRVVRRNNKFLNYISFFRVVLRELNGKDVAYSLDWIAAGLPLTIAAAIHKIPVVIRVGGDYIWETYLRALASPIPLREFYEQGLHKNYVTLFSVIRFVLQRAFVIFNSDTQRDMYHQHYGLRPEHTAVVYNPVPDIRHVTRDGPNDEIVFAGRFIPMKNVFSLLEAFATARIPYRLVLIGSGPEEHRVRNAVQELRIADRVSVLATMQQPQLFDRIRNARALVLPSWTDISPNEVTEALALGIPILVTKENYLPFKRELPEMLDPSSVDDVRDKLEMLRDEDRYERFAEKFGSIVFENSWDDVAARHIDIFKTVLNKEVQKQ